MQIGLVRIALGRGCRSEGEEWDHGTSKWRPAGFVTSWVLRRADVATIVGEGNGNPLRCYCLENPRDGRAWWAAVYGVTQSWTRLKRLSSSSSSHHCASSPWGCLSASYVLVYVEMVSGKLYGGGCVYRYSHGTRGSDILFFLFWIFIKAVLLKDPLGFSLGRTHLPQVASFISEMIPRLFHKY